ncbi:FAD binding domain-containing protein [Haloechinothrix salitolerans]|uniref:FAD binding domain-containing protein n=1 Tax=Haloechinothrix salitolerans TaxID=926830 RepID=A0ABW2BWF3_9PSEU
MSTTVAKNGVHIATSMREAAAMLADLGEAGEAIAGGTWIMRAPDRDVPAHRQYVVLKHVPELFGVSVADSVDIGAMTTHTELGGIEAGPALSGIRQAARESAFPQVRNVATVGGNIRAIGFAEADLVPAMLAARARLELTSPTGTSEEDIGDYLATRHSRPAGELIGRVRVPAPKGRASAFERLTVRATGEYPIVNVAVSVDIDDSVVRDARIAVGSVEPVAKLCVSASQALIGHRLGDSAAVDAAGVEAAGELTSREGLDAPGWYRLAVLPALIRRAIARIDLSSA